MELFIEDADKEKAILICEELKNDKDKKKMTEQIDNCVADVKRTQQLHDKINVLSKEWTDMQTKWEEHLSHHAKVESRQDAQITRLGSRQNTVD